MYALVNQMYSNSRSFGMIISRHKSVESAEQANKQFQNKVKRRNGATSYIPTVIVEGVHSGHDALRTEFKLVERE